MATIVSRNNSNPSLWCGVVNLHRENKFRLRLFENKEETTKFEIVEENP